MKNDEKINRRVIEVPQIRKISSEERTMEFVASDGSIDSYGTVMDVTKWDLSRFERNGIIGYQHNLYGDGDDCNPDFVIGKGEAFIEDSQLIVKITFEPAELNEMADKIFRKIQFGSIKAVSVGFMPQGGHYGDKERGEDPDVYYFDGQQLIEVSVVNIPSNANALKRSIEENRGMLPERSAVIEPKREDLDLEEIQSEYILTKAKAVSLLAEKTI